MMLKLSIFALFVAWASSSPFENVNWNALHDKAVYYNSLNLPDLNQRYKPTFPVKTTPKNGKVPSPSQQCNPGFAGPNCANPICYNKSIIAPHDGKADFGELLESDFSTKCSDSFHFFVDNYVNDFYVIIESLNGGSPRATVINPVGDEVESCGTFSKSDSQVIHLYCDTKQVHGTGVYTVQLEVDGDSACLFEIKAQTSLSADGGFVQDQRDDNVQTFLASKANQGVFRYPVENSSSYFAFVVENEKYPAHVETLHIYRSGLWDMQFNISARYGCSAPHITATPYICTSLSMYHIKLQGYDDLGYQWQRIYDFDCDAPAIPTDVTPPTPFTEVPVVSCENGGTLYKDECYCGEFFSGLQCEVSLCLNGGHRTERSGVCVCEDGYSGDHCQHVSCPVPSTDKFEESSIAIGFVIRSAASMAAQIEEIEEAAIQISSFYSVYYSNYVQQYVLTVVQNNTVYFTNEYDSATSFITSIRSITTPPTDTECDDALLLGVADLLNTPSFKQYSNSPVFVFSDGVSNDGIEVKSYVMERIVSTHAKINFIITDSASGACVSDVSSNQYEDLRAISQLSKGLLVQTNVTQLAELTKEIATEQWQLDTILVNDLEDCRAAPTYQPFFIDSSVDLLLLQATGENLIPRITYPNLTHVEPILKYQSGNFYVWSAEKPPVGAYLLNIASRGVHSSVCQYRLGARSIYHIYGGVTNSLTADNTYDQPVMSQSSHLVARIDNLLLVDPIDTTIEAIAWFNDPQTGKRQTLFSSSGFWRDTCLYDLYFGQFTCPSANLILSVNVYVNDVFGETVLRTFNTYCSAKEPTPIDADCLNGGVYFNKTCYCPTHFSGTKCEKIVCENGATTLFGVCQCKNGFSGQFCEISQCLERNPWGFWGFNQKSLTLIIHDSLTTRSTLRTINEVAPRVIHSTVLQHNQWLTNYQLVKFNNTAHNFLVDSGNATDLINGISSLYESNKQHASYTCQNLNILGSLLDVINNENVQWGGIVYIFVYGKAEDDWNTYLKIMEKIETNKLVINVVQSSLNPCGTSLSDDGLLGLTQFSGGSYIVASTPNAGKVFSHIPSEYMSGLVYENTLSDCSNSDFYIPIDSGTQSFSVNILGDLTQAPSYRTPDGSDVNIVNVFQDDGTGSRMDFVIRSCDDGWTAYDSYCIKFSTTTESWYDATRICHAETATLVNIFNAKEQSILHSVSYGAQFWIGLNDLETLGTYKWDTLNTDFPISLLDSGYTNWLNGQPGVSNDTRCVLDANDDKNVGWKTEDCAKKSYFMCMKHAYSTNYAPSDPEQDLLPRGIWKINLKADGPCSISVKSQSSIQVNARFSSNIHDDIGNNEPNRNIETNRALLHVTNVQNENALEYAHFYYDNQTILQAHTLSQRDNCMYNFISTTFTCPTPTFQMLVTGVDDNGYLYQRIIPAACVGGLDKDSCNNGGVFYKGSCICSPNFSGLTCEYAVCQNRGTLAASLDRCNCPSGFSGDFCQTPVCTRNFLDIPNTQSTQRTFVVVVDGTSNDDMANVNERFSDILGGVLRDTLAADPNWFTNFVGIVFRDSASNPSISDVITSSNSTNFVAALTTELHAHPYTASQKKRDIFSAIVKAVTHSTVVPNSHVYVITAGNAEDTIDEATVVAALSKSHSSLNFLILGDDGPPGDATSYDDASVSYIFESAHFTGGAVYQLFNSTELQKSWTLILESYRNSYYVLSHHLTNCSNYIDYIPLDSNGTSVLIDFFAQREADISVSDQYGAHVKSSTLVISKKNQLIEFDQQGEQPGIWSIYLDKNVVNAGACLLNIRAQSNIHVDLGFTSDTASDDGLHDGSAVSYPHAEGFDNAVVADTDSGVLTYAQIYDLEESRLAWASPLIKRDNCAYPYVSRDTFKCHRNQFVVTLDGLDYEGHSFRRSYTIHCEGKIDDIPTLAPTEYFSTDSQEFSTSTGTTNPTCDPSNPNIDIVIALDSSSGLSEELYYSTILAINQIGAAITLSSDKGRVALVTYDTEYHYHGDLNNITDMDVFSESLVDLKQFGYTGANGNNLQSVFDYISVINTTSPFRSSPTRKLLIFFSSQGWDKGNTYDGVEHGFSDPTPLAQAWVQAGLEIYGIGVGSEANMTQLGAVAKCVSKTSTGEEISSTIAYITSLLCDSTLVC